MMMSQRGSYNTVLRPIGCWVAWLYVFLSDIPEDSSVRSCPSTSVVVDMIISNCAIQVMYSIRVYQIEPCM